MSGTKKSHRGHIGGIRCYGIITVLVLTNNSHKSNDGCAGRYHGAKLIFNLRQIRSFNNAAARLMPKSFIKID